MKWCTRVTDLLGCKYPIVQGAMHQFGTWQFAANVARTGAYGTITASTCKTPAELRENIDRCRESVANSGGTFGVNLSIGICPSIEHMVDVCAEEKVVVETSVYKPDMLVPRIKAGGLKWIHKTARIKDAVYAQKLGADAIILVGLEGAGIKSPDQLPTMTTIIWGRKQITVPLIAAGGIGDAHGFLAALGMGADGIMMGTAFALAEECPASNSAKLAAIGTLIDDRQFRQRVLGQVALKPVSPKPESLSPPDELKLDQEASFAIGVIDHISSVDEFIETIVSGAERILDGWSFLRP